jgi:Peptidase family M28
MRGAALAILVVGLCGFCAAQKVRFSPASRSEVLQRAKNTPTSDQERARLLIEWFRQAGCKGNLLTEQKVDGTEIPNIICRMKGKSNDTIVVGAHYDRVISPQRPFDNWTGSLLLPTLYQCLRTRRRRHTILFVAFADNRSQVSGAETFVNQLSPSELGEVKAMVNLDALGLSPTKVWSDHSDKELVQSVMTMVYAMKIPASQIDIGGAGKSDSDPFLARKIPQITIHSLTQANLIAGRATAFEPSAFFDSYRLICGFLAYIDENRKSRIR